MKNEPIDAVKMTRQIRDRIYEETKHLSTNELLRYIKEHGQPGSQRQERTGEGESERDERLA